MLDALADTLQMRVRPEEKETEYLIDDPEVVERLQFEERVQRERADRQVPPLERGALRMAYAIHRRHEECERERENFIGTSAMGEFYG
jgi:hypothetical protein